MHIDISKETNILDNDLFWGAHKMEPSANGSCVLKPEAQTDRSMLAHKIQVRMISPESKRIIVFIVGTLVWPTNYP